MSDYSRSYVQSVTDFFSRIGLIHKLVPLISAITMIYVLFMLAVLIGFTKEKSDSFVMLVGYTNLLQLIALPVLRISKLANPTLMILYLIFNGISVAGILIVFSLVYLPFGDLQASQCSMEKLIINMYGLSLIVMEILVVFQYRYVMKHSSQIMQKIQVNVPLPANNAVKVEL